MPQSQTQLPFSFVPSLSVSCLFIVLTHSPFISYSFALRLCRSFQWWSEYFYLISSKNSSQKKKCSRQSPCMPPIQMPSSYPKTTCSTSSSAYIIQQQQQQQQHWSKCTLTKRILWIFDLFNCNISQDRSYFCTFHGITVQNIKMCRFDLT